ncbi:hypothetical protein E2562_018519 [Oryza meyeriana var. granulata]|uniref:HTH myb-type domain-containing protein n=1 Tax=Oryza meyeriana var. granulata TaxID=110450 RepID=A0A6G1F9C1_9ORYZ|nr:hypothetical protein E2562_018519 [Oryza meyeriana var. granulata]
MESKVNAATVSCSLFTLWSSLFKIYFVEIDKQFDEAASTDRKCNCRGDGIDQHQNSSNFTSDIYINNSESPSGKLSSESYAIDTSACDSSLPPTQSSYKSSPSSLRMVYAKVSEQNSWSEEPLPGLFVCPTSVDFFNQQDVTIFDQQIQDNIATSPNTSFGKQNQWFLSGTSWQYLESSDSDGSVLKADATRTSPSNYSHCHAPRNTSNLPNFSELCSGNLTSSNIAPNKPRMRWTPELHERFVDAVNKLGGSEKATPKAIQKVMKVEGLTIYHKYRTVHHQPELSDGESAERSGQTNEVSSQPMKGMETCEGLRVQIGLQKQLHEQLEIQRKLQVQVEEHSKYLAMMIAKQSESLKQLEALPRSLDAARSGEHAPPLTAAAGCASSTTTISAALGCTTSAHAAPSLRPA